MICKSFELECLKTCFAFFILCYSIESRRNYIKNLLCGHEADSGTEKLPASTKIHHIWWWRVWLNPTHENNFEFLNVEVTVYFPDDAGAILFILKDILEVDSWENNLFR